jgi:hypothetical protein
VVQRLHRWREALTHHAPRSLPVFSTSLITFNTPSNLSVKRVPTEHERWAFAIDRLRPLLTLVNGHPERLVGSIRRECVARLFDGSLKNAT